MVTTVKTVFGSVLLALLFVQPILAQDDFHIIPQVADGVFNDGTYYKSTLMVLPWFESTATTCSVRFYGLSVNFGAGFSDNFSLTLSAGGHSLQVTGADQAFRSGYATVTCTGYVFVRVLYSFYAVNGVKLSEATVFSSEGDFNVSDRLFVDQREGSRLAVAIANNTDLPRTYRLEFGTMTGTVQVPARSSVARFVDELMNLPANAVGLLRIASTDFSSFGAIGLRFTRAVFTTIPAN